MKKLLDSDWSRAVQLLCNSVQKSVIPIFQFFSMQKFVVSCNYTISKLISQSKC